MKTSFQRTALAPALAAVALAVTLAGCGGKDAPPTAQTVDKGNGAASATVGATAAAAAAANEPVRPVRTLVAGAAPLMDATYLPGEVRARHEQRLGFRVGGKLARRAVEVGDAVKPGQLLAELDAQDVVPAINAAAAQVEVARADVKLQQAELKRVQELRERGFVGAAQLDRQQAATDAAVARLRAAESQLANAQNARAFQSLRADRAGVVVGIDAEAGTVVAAGQSVVRIAQSGEREIVVAVPERAVGTLRKAQGFAAVVDALPGKVYALALRELAPAADPASRTYAARFSVKAPDEALKLGMSATVALQFGQAAAIVVPVSALYTRDAKPRVWVVDGASSTVRLAEVTLGETTAEGVVIREGLKPGDRVVTAGANLLLPGQRVRVLEAAAAGEPKATQATQAVRT